MKYCISCAVLPCRPEFNRRGICRCLGGEYMKKFSILVFAILLFATGCNSETYFENNDTYSRFEGNNLHLKKNNKELFWFSGIHCNDPNHRMFEDIKREFLTFKPDLVLVEGYTDKYFYSNEKEAILKGGEPGFVVYLAKANNVPVENIEPPLADQYEYLLQKFCKEDILAMYVLRQTVQYQRESENIEIDFLKSIIGYINNTRKNGFPIDTETIDHEFVSNLLEPYIGFKVNNSNWKDIKANDLVYLEDNILHSIWKETIKHRDDHCVGLISEKMKEYDRIFIMMGADHIKNQKDRLKELFK